MSGTSSGSEEVGPPEENIFDNVSDAYDKENEQGGFIDPYEEPSSGNDHDVDDTPASPQEMEDFDNDQPSPDDYDSDDSFEPLPGKDGDSDDGGADEG